MFATLILLVLPTCQIAIGEQQIKVEIADTPKAQMRGLMGRKSLSQGHGMLFVYEKPEILSFWMKDTEIPLSIAFFDEKKRLIEVYDMPVPSKSAAYLSYKSSKPAVYALEVPMHWFQENGIAKGMEFSFLDLPDRLE
jgi:uncharacterized membrane protein (UPF0127 family)